MSVGLWALEELLMLSPEAVESCAHLRLDHVGTGPLWTGGGPRGCLPSASTPQKTLRTLKWPSYIRGMFPGTEGEERGLTWKLLREPYMRNGVCDGGRKEGRKEE